MARPLFGDPTSRERPSTVDGPSPAASSCAGAAGKVCFTGAALQAVPPQGSTSPTGGPAHCRQIPVERELGLG